MNFKSRVFITDCEGPLSKNDNAFELTKYFVPDGEYFFTLISRYDDVLADIVKKPRYKSGDTLRLILPFLKAYGATNQNMKNYSSKNILLLPGANETLRFVRTIMPAFIVSTSYEHYISSLCSAVGFPQQNAYCTRLDIDKYELIDGETVTLRSLRKEISEMPMIEIHGGEESLDNLSSESQYTVKRLDEIFWEEIQQMKSGWLMKEVNPVGGFEKTNAVKEIIKKVNTDISEVIYIGDSITDVDPFRLIRNGGGLAVAFNGNHYAVREAEVAVLSHHTIVISILAEIFNKYGKEFVIDLPEKWLPSHLEDLCSPKLFNRLKALYSEKRLKIEKITSRNKEYLMQESGEFRKAVRGVAIGRLG